MLPSVSLVALAFLAKPSLLPFLIVFALAFCLRALLALNSGTPEWRAGRNLAGMVLVAAILAVMLPPLALFSEKYFGSPLFNYTKYWMWMDDFMTEAWPFSGQVSWAGAARAIAAGRETFSQMYFQKHGLDDAPKRPSSGTWEVFSSFFLSGSQAAVERAFGVHRRKVGAALSSSGHLSDPVGSFVCVSGGSLRTCVRQLLRRPGNIAGLLLRRPLGVIYFAAVWLVLADRSEAIDLWAVYGSHLSSR